MGEEEYEDDDCDHELAEIDILTGRARCPACLEVWIPGPDEREALRGTTMTDMTTPDASEGLGPCPFCGGEAVVHEDDWGHPSDFDVVCLGCYVRTVSAPTPAAAIAAWNRRTPKEGRAR